MTANLWRNKPEPAMSGARNSATAGDLACRSIISRLGPRTRRFPRCQKHNTPWAGAPFSSNTFFRNVELQTRDFQLRYRPFALLVELPDPGARVPNGCGTRSGGWRKPRVHLFAGVVPCLIRLQKSPIYNKNSFTSDRKIRMHLILLPVPRACPEYRKQPLPQARRL